MKRTMLNTMAGLLLGSTMLAAHAAGSINTTAFNLTLEEGSAPDISLELLSATEDTVRIRLDNLQASPFVSTTGDVTEFDAEEAFARLAGQVNAGYRITSLTLDVTSSGNLDVPVYEPCGGCTLDSAGSAVNHGQYIWTLVQGDASTHIGFGEQSNLDGMQFLASTSVQSLTGEFGLDTTLLSTSSAAPLIWYGTVGGEQVRFVDSSSASFFIGHVELTVQVAQVVPEPATYAMLLTGLGVAGWAARARTRPQRS